jgi:hypothetical protein
MASVVGPSVGGILVITKSACAVVPSAVVARTVIIVLPRIVEPPAFATGG